MRVAVATADAVDDVVATKSAADGVIATVGAAVVLVLECDRELDGDVKINNT